MAPIRCFSVACSVLHGCLVAGHCISSYQALPSHLQHTSNRFDTRWQQVATASSWCCEWLSAAATITRACCGACASASRCDDACWNMQNLCYSHPPSGMAAQCLVNSGFVPACSFVFTDVTENARLVTSCTICSHIESMFDFKISGAIGIPHKRDCCDV